MMNRFKDDASEVMVVELGARISKAVSLKKEGKGALLQKYAMEDAPIYEGSSPPQELIQEHLQSLQAQLQAKTKNLVLVLSPADSYLSHAELPSGRVSILRGMIRANPKKFLSQELSNHLFDCFSHHVRGGALRAAGINPGSTAASVDSKDGPSEAGRSSRTANYLVGGCRHHFVNDLQNAALALGLQLRRITLSQVGAVNGYLGLSEASGEAIAIVDVGFRHSTINILLNREFVLTRRVAIGADTFTGGLAEIMKINYAAAEGIKLVMPDKVQAKLQGQISLFGSELRASLDYFENQYDCHVSQVMVLGGSARSEFIVQTLEQDWNIPCRAWNLAESSQVGLSEGENTQIAKDGPQLASAIGAGIAFFQPDLIQINLLAERQEAEEERRRDPVRRSRVAGYAVIGLMLAWTVFSGARYVYKGFELGRLQKRLFSLHDQSKAVTDLSKRAGEVERRIAALHSLSTNRFLWANALNALQFVSSEGIQFLGLEMRKLVEHEEAEGPTIDQVLQGIQVAEGSTTIESYVLEIRAKDYGSSRQKDEFTPMYQEFIYAIESYEYFKRNLEAVQPVTLLESQAPAVDTVDFSRKYVLFTIQCNFKSTEIIE